MGEVVGAVFVGGCDGYAVGIDVCVGVDGGGWEVGVVRGGEEAEEGSGGEVGVAFCLGSGGWDVSCIRREVVVGNGTNCDYDALPCA